MPFGRGVKECCSLLYPCIVVIDETVVHHRPACNTDIQDHRQGLPFQMEQEFQVRMFERLDS